MTRPAGSARSSGSAGSSPSRSRQRAATHAPAAAPSRRTTAIGVRYLGHATVLLELPGLRILTDPFLRDRLGPLRRHGPTPLPAAIGPVDVVVISHAHPDHFDRSSLKALLGDPLVIVPRGMGAAVRRAGLRAREVLVDESVGVAARWTVTAVPARHWRWPGAPTARTIGYLIQGPGRTGIYFAGDTARFTGMKALAGRVDLALLPVGSWGPHLGPGHLRPRSAADAARDVTARFVVPIHWGTLFPPRFERAFGAQLREPAVRFAALVGERAPSVEVRMLQPGESTRLDL